MITDNEEFYKKEKSISLQNVKELFNILKEELWQLLWVIPSKILTGHENLIHSV
jgi:ubiquitin-protein ligase E3 C